MNRFYLVRLVAIVCLAGLLMLNPAAGAEEYEYIDISNPFLRKIPTAVPRFKNLSGNQAAGTLAVELSDRVADTLAFTGYFEMLDRGAFLADPENPNIVASRIKFHNWTAIGSELLITGGVASEGESIELELRLFDTFQEKMIIGKRYKGNRGNQRQMINRFCSEVMLNLTGNRGVFDSRIAFVSASNGKKEIYIAEFDGYNPRQFTNNNDISLFPAWSSDGKWMAYTSYAGGGPDLYIRNIKEKYVTIVSKKGIQITPAWVPGKFELAATLSFSGDQEIYLLTGRGKIIKRLTQSRGIDVEPTWSPDGSEMAFVSKRSGTPQVYVKNMGSGRVRRLTYEGRYNTQPNWSPKGDRIAFSAMVPGSIDIYTIGVDGKGLRRLTEGQGDNEAPCWSPDGSLIAFSSNREGISKVYIMTAFGTDQRRLISLPGAQTSPKWSPNITNQ
ncbi:MAG: Tol-Pal system beta propeller repeat protein TolB [Deltaproteobacteria bacterium]|nr:Tol-Pal system beta propeller repeat protein TolB [Deltaproteobacteria bacterium]